MTEPSFTDHQFIKGGENTPQPQIGELPTSYATRMGARFLNKMGRSSKGQIFTPSIVAKFMARKTISRAKKIRVLEPGAGMGILSCAVIEEFVDRHREGSILVDAVEIESSMVPFTTAVLAYARSWAANNGIIMEFSIKTADFIEIGVSQSLGPQEILVESDPLKYDIIIMNPPFFKVPSTDPRIKIVAAFAGKQTNIYSFFLSVAATMLRPKGILVSINPRSFASGKYFKRFRQSFFKMVRLEEIHLFESRKDVFPDADILQETLIIVAKAFGTSRNETGVVVSTSEGAKDIEASKNIQVPRKLVLAESSERRLAIPRNPHDLLLLKIVNSWENRLHTLGLEISTGPVVPFRAKTLLVTDCTSESRPTVPLLWMNNVTQMCVRWPLDNGKPEYIVDTDKNRKLLVSNNRFVLLRRISSKEEKKRLVAAVIPENFFTTERIGFENHLSFIHSQMLGLEKNLSYGFAILLNSSLMDKYFRIMNGSTQVNAYDIRLMPLPKGERIEEIGAKFLRSDVETPIGQEAIDRIVETVLDLKGVF